MYYSHLAVEKSTQPYKFPFLALGTKIEKNYGESVDHRIDSRTGNEKYETISTKNEVGRKGKCASRQAN